VAVTSFGLFVELKDLYIEGLVHVTGLPGDYYHFDPAKARLLGERSGRSYQLGGGVRVKVARVDLDDRKIDLELIDGESGAKRGKGKPDRTRSGAGKKGAGGKKPAAKKKGGKGKSGDASAAGRKTGHRRRR
jgi:ribonuclease R